jgi:hypothetical protein
MITDTERLIDGFRGLPAGLDAIGFDLNPETN